MSADETNSAASGQADGTLQWFSRPGDDRPGTLNPVYGLLDRAIIDGAADDAVITAVGPTGQETTLSAAEALDRVAKIAGSLRLFAVGPGVPVRIASGVAPLSAELVKLAIWRVGGCVVWGDENSAHPAPVVVEPEESAEPQQEPAPADESTAQAHSPFDKPLRRIPSRVEGLRVHDDRDGASLDALVRDGRIEPAAVEPLRADHVIEITPAGSRVTALDAARAVAAG